MSLGLNRRDRIAVLVLGILLLLLLVADKWISLPSAPLYPSPSNPEDSFEKKGAKVYSSKSAYSYDSQYFNVSKKRYSKTKSQKKYYQSGYHNNSQFEPQNKVWLEQRNQHRNLKTNENVPEKLLLINLNDADSSSLIPLPGIGPALASRIIKYRNKLGGFFSIEQVRETYGITDSVFNLIADMISVKDSSWNLIHVNTITATELKLHPYFKWQFANAIINYRKAHGPYTSINDLKKITIINEEFLIKISPYISFE